MLFARMPHPTARLTIALTLLAACTAIGAPWVTVSKGRGYLISMRHAPSTGSFAAVSNWNIRQQHGNLVLRWTCTPFHHVDDPSITNDAIISAHVTAVKGSIAATPSSDRDQTDIASNDRQASIDVQLQGTGKVDLDMHVELSDIHAAAGTHCSTVALTITAP